VQTALLAALAAAPLIGSTVTQLGDAVRRALLRPGEQLVTAGPRPPPHVRPLLEAMHWSDAARRIVRADTPLRIVSTMPQRWRLKAG
jgi:hypothetical protein